MERQHGQRSVDLSLQRQIIQALPTFESDAPIRAVYFLLRGSRVVYVGQTTNLVQRIAIHEREEVKLFDGIRYLAMPVGNMNLVENEFVSRLQPEYNGINAKKRPPATMGSINRMACLENKDFGRANKR